MKKAIFLFAFLIFSFNLYSQIWINADTVRSHSVQFKSDQSKILSNDTSSNFTTATHTETASKLAIKNYVQSQIPAEAVDTLADYSALRAYSGESQFIYLTERGINGLFHANGSGTDDGIININSATAVRYSRIYDQDVGYSLTWGGAIGNDSLDDRVAIQNVIDYVDSTFHGGILLLPSDTFFISINPATNAGLHLYDNMMLQMQPGTRLECTSTFPSTSSTMIASSSSISNVTQAEQNAGNINIHIDGGEIYFQNFVFFRGCGIGLGGVFGGSINNVTVRNNGGYAIWMVKNNDDGTTEGTATYYVTVSNCRIYESGDVGLEFSGAVHCVATNIVITMKATLNLTGYGVIIWNGSQYCRAENITIAGLNPTIQSGNVAVSIQTANPHPVSYGWRATQNNTIDGVVATGVENGVYMGTDRDSLPQFNNVIRNGEFTGKGLAFAGKAFQISTSVGDALENCRFSNYQESGNISGPIAVNDQQSVSNFTMHKVEIDSAQSALDVYGVDRFTMTNCKFNNIANDGVTSGTAVLLRGVTNAKILSNEFRNIGDNTGAVNAACVYVRKNSGTSSKQSKHLTFSGNVGEDTRATPAMSWLIFLQDSTDIVTLDGNNMASAKTGSTTMFNNGTGTNVTVSDRTFLGHQFWAYSNINFSTDGGASKILEIAPVLTVSNSSRFVANVFRGSTWFAANDSTGLLVRGINGDISLRSEPLDYTFRNGLVDLTLTVYDRNVTVAANTVYLPPSPKNGQTHYIKWTGLGTLDGNGNTIDGLTSVTAFAGDAKLVKFNGVEWKVFGGINAGASFISGSGTADRMAIWSGSSSLTSSPTFLVDGTTMAINGALDPNYFLYVNGRVRIGANFQMQSDGGTTAEQASVGGFSWYTNTGIGSTPSGLPEMELQGNELHVVGNIGAGTITPTGRIHTVENQNSVTDMGVVVEQEGVGDAFANFKLTATKDVSIGLDNSDADKFKVSFDPDLANFNVFQALHVSGTFAEFGLNTSSVNGTSLAMRNRTTNQNYLRLINSAGTVGAEIAETANSNNVLRIYDSGGTNTINLGTQEVSFLSADQAISFGRSTGGIGKMRILGLTGNAQLLHMESQTAIGYFSTHNTTTGALGTDGAWWINDGADLLIHNKEGGTAEIQLQVGTGTVDVTINQDGDIETVGAIISSEIILDNTNDVKIVVGSGSPELSVVAGVGSTYHRTDGGAGTSFYVKESGIGNIGWVAK